MITTNPVTGLNQNFVIIPVAVLLPFQRRQVNGPLRNGSESELLLEFFMRYALAFGEFLP